MSKKKETTEKKPDVVQIARTQRHLYLLQKAKSATADPGSPPLSRTELTELAAFENAALKEREQSPGLDDKTSLAAENIINTQKQAAGYAKVSTRTIRRWVDDVMRLTEDDRYIKAMLYIWKPNKHGGDREVKVQQEESDARTKAAKAGLLELELKNKQKKFISYDEVQHGRVLRVQAIRNVLRLFPRKLPPLLFGKSKKRMAAILKREVEYAISVFAGTENEKEK